MTTNRKVLAVDGDGIGPEILQATRLLFTAAQVPVDLENPNRLVIGIEALKRNLDPLSATFLDTFKKYGVALKPPYETPKGNLSMKSINVAWRVAGDLYANKRPVKSIPGISVPRACNDDLIIIYEHDDLLQQQELTVGKTELTTTFPMEEASYLRAIERAIAAAQRSGKTIIHLIHKANIVKPFEMLSRQAETMQKNFPTLTFKTMIIDDFAHQMIKNPTQFEIVVIPAQFGSIGAGLQDGLQSNRGFYTDVNIHLTRENSEDVYANTYAYNKEETTARVTFTLSAHGYDRIIKSAIDDAKKRGNKTVTFVYDDVFDAYRKGAKHCQEFAETYNPSITFNTIHVRDYIKAVIQNPSQFIEVVTTNMLGDILSDLHAGLIGGLGLVGSANIGDHYAMFEAVHGTAPNIAGAGIANPTGLIMASIMMLHHLGLDDYAETIENALLTTLANKENHTGDLGGKKNTNEFINAVISNLEPVYA